MLPGGGPEYRERVNVVVVNDVVVVVNVVVGYHSHNILSAGRGGRGLGRCNG